VTNFQSLKESDFPQWLQSHTQYGAAAISNATISAKIRYSKYGTWLQAKLQNCIQNCSQTAADKDMVTTNSL